MKKTFACWPLLIIFWLVGTATIHARTIRIMNVQSIDCNQNLNQVIDLRSLTRDGGTYLGVIAERSKKNPLQAVYRIVRLDHRGHCVEIGPPFHGPLNLNNDAVEWMASNNAPDRYPQVIVRDRWAKTCPYLLVTPLTLRCVQHNLTFPPASSQGPTATVVPFNIRGIHIMNGDVWVEGIHQGALAHKWDPKTGQIVDHALSLAPLIKSLKKPMNFRLKHFWPCLKKSRIPSRISRRSTPN